MQPPSVATVYATLLTVSRNAFADGLVEVSYHALCAAMYAAAALSDEDRLLEVAYQATEYQATLDQQAPRHRLASRQGRRGLFEVLSRLALQHYVMVQHRSFRDRPS